MPVHLPQYFSAQSRRLLTAHPTIATTIPATHWIVIPQPHLGFAVFLGGQPLTCYCCRKPMGVFGDQDADLSLGLAASIATTPFATISPCALSALPAMNATSRSPSLTLSRSYGLQTSIRE